MTTLEAILKELKRQHNISRNLCIYNDTNESSIEIDGQLDAEALANAVDENLDSYNTQQKDDKMNIEIKHYSGLNYTPAALLATEAQLDLLQSGMSEPLTSIFWDDESIIAFVDNFPRGIITWKYTEWLKTIHIHIGWVDSDFRRSGIYTKMWNELVIKARELKAKHIMGTTHLNNHTMREMAKSLGRVEISVNLSYKLDGDI